MILTFVTQWFPPEPAEVALSIATALAESGHEVRVLTGIPNYPDGQVVAGYHAWKPTSEAIAGLQVRRAPLVPSHSQSALGRITNYVSWALTSAVTGLRFSREADVTLVYSSPATAALGPMIWKWASGVPYVLLIQDLWPDSVLSSGMVNKGWNRIVERALSAFVRWTYVHASHVAVSSPGMIEVLEARGVPRSKLSVVYNWSPHENAPTPSRSFARATLGISDEAFVVTYAGNLGAVQGLDSLVSAASHLDEGVTVLMVGDGTQASSLRSQAGDLGLNNIRFLGHVDPEAMRTVHGATDVHVASLVADPLFKVTMPSKIQTILAFAKPLIVVGSGDAADVVTQAKAGWWVAPGDAVGLAAAITNARAAGRDALRQRGDLGRAFYQRTMSRRVGASSLDQHVRKAAAASPRRGRTKNPSRSPD